MKKKKEFATAEEYTKYLSLNERASLIRNIRLKHRILLELVSRGLSLKEVTGIKVREIDLISGIIQIRERFIRLPKYLCNLIRFHLRNNQYQTFLIETSHGQMREEAAEKIIRTISLRSLGKPLSSYDLPSFSHPLFFFPLLQDQNPSFQPALPLMAELF